MSLVPVISLPNGRRMQIHQCLSDPAFYIIVVSHEWAEELGTTLYEFEIGIAVDSDMVEVHRSKHRFSELRGLYEYLSRVYHKQLKSMDLTFPGKKWFFSNSKQVVERRAKEMQEFFSKALAVVDFIHDPRFLSMFVQNG